MASEVDLCNQALGHIGSDAVVSSIDPPDGSVEAGHCARFLPIARRALIELSLPNWAKRREQLSEVDNPSTVWQFAYALPSECIKPLRVLQTGAFAGYLPSGAIFDQWASQVDVLLEEQGSAHFEIETDAEGALILLTNEPTAVLLYLRDVQDPGKFTPAFQAALGEMLGSYLAGPIIKGTEGMRVAKALRDMATLDARSAAASNANSSATTHAVTPSWISARR